ncbi:MAG TPA: 30S ribosomal protein S20 [Bacillota bacterium]|nr:30S ribosomal protein S20 [Bacillota bacterium]HNY68965.1 30S ribosomal protein S20 [Bacillota bacterium]HOI37049.1 30S ribosomal protein S20 [Bacillota bacterium]HPU75801.1 30S ribosomal protein S20 [Bacillota bacterium]
MPNIKSAKKRVKTMRVRTLRNAAIKSSVKTAIRKCNEALVQAGPEGSVSELNRAFSTVDRAARKGVIHKNQAARRKSRLARRANKAAQAE